MLVLKLIQVRKKGPRSSAGTLITLYGSYMHVGLALEKLIAL